MRLPEHLRSDIEAIRPLPVPLPPIESQGKATPALWGNSPLAPLPAAVGTRPDRSRAGPNLISREDRKRRIVVTANVRGRDPSDPTSAQFSSVTFARRHLLPRVAADL